MQLGGVLGVEVGLAGDLGFIEAEDVFGEVALHLLLALVPLRVVLGTPEARHPLELAVELLTGPSCQCQYQLTRPFARRGR